MPEAPRPPFLPSDLEEFTEHAADHYSEWFDYCRLAYEYIQNAEATIAEANGRVQTSQLEVNRLEGELTTLHHQYERSQARDQGIREYQKEQLQEMQQKYLDAVKENDRVLSLATPTVNTPRPQPALTPESIAKTPEATSMEAPPSIDSQSASSAKLSERLPDPDRFEGDRKDLRRFVSQIHEKMNVNRDRYPTSQSRMTYVTNRLRGAPYAQILPHIKRGICQLKDYEDILDILDRAFGDPNRVNNARNELFRLRQTNKEFGVFFAEFQRLALEGEMSEEALPTLLEQAINRELRGMLIHNEPPTREYHQFANFLQDLENRRRHYEGNQQPAIRAYASAAKPITSQPVPRMNPVKPAERVTTPPSANPDAMDLSSTRQFATSRRERGECFRCGSKEHLIRSCPHPDNRPLKVRPIHSSPSPEPSIRGRSPLSRSPSPDMSAKGVSLA